MDGVARVRELERREPPTLASVPREELVERALERAEASTGPGSLEAEARLFSALELVPAGHAWRPTLRRAFEANLWAFFDPERDQIGRRQPRLVQRGLQHRAGALPDFDGIVLDPAGLGQDLFVLELVASDLTT